MSDSSNECVRRLLPPILWAGGGSTHTARHGVRKALHAAFVHNMADHIPPSQSARGTLAAVWWSTILSEVPECPYSSRVMAIAYQVLKGPLG